MDLKQIAYCKLFPSIGIARVGNSPTEFFIGPERPGIVPAPPGGFRDPEGRVKRQAARFRVFAFDERGGLLGEICGQDAEITWTVALANKKPAWYEFDGAEAVEAAFVSGKALPLRNHDIQGEFANHPDRRDKLCITPPPGKVSGIEEQGPELVGQVFDPPHPVYLGELRTDEAGRLLVLGGRGMSASVFDDNPLKHYANNRGWYDDVADGPVTAHVVVAGKEIEVRGRSWVVVGPPSFAPHTDNVVTIYDTMVEAALELNLPWSESECGPKPDRNRVSFQDDIYPILYRLVNYQWVSQRALRGHGDGKPGDFLRPDVLEMLSKPGGAGKRLRQFILSKVRNPHLDKDSNEAKAQANLFHMPPLSGDEGDATHGAPDTWLSVTRLQYDKLSKWSEDKFTSDWNGKVSVPFTESPAEGEDVSPRDLTMAALLACEGGAFYPGIEITSIIRFREFYSDAFRVSEKLSAGDITKWMALPWQADFYECQLHWWPAQRPDDVVNEEQFEHVVRDFPSEQQGRRLSTLFEERQRWDRGVGSQAVPEPAPPNLPPRNPGETIAAHYARAREVIERYVGGMFRLPEPAQGEPDEAYGYRIARILAGEWVRRRRTAGDNDMVRRWSTLGFVVPREVPSGEVVLVETDRGRFEGLTDREYFFYMMNIESYPEFLPQASILARAFLAEARRKQETPGEMDHDYYLPFEYSPTAFRARLEQIYEALRVDAEAYDPADPDQEPTFRARDQVIQRILQMAPFNQTDGAWLRNAGNVGPTDEIRALIFSIWMDEVGNGDPGLNHPNVYVTLLQSLGIYLPPINSRAYADHPDFLDSAFTVPVFELVISQFTEEFFPEILGMTLQLEWEVIYLKRAIKLYNYHGIDPHFLNMHVAIDNAVEGHGARARRAVELYLDHVRQESGVTEMQEHWRRIWDGYVAFATTGSLFADLRFTLTHPPSLRERMVRLIQSRKSFGQKNHGQKMLGENFINEWFEDPEAFLDALARSRFIAPGHPDQSEVFRLTSFAGPMYKVFSDRDLKLWADWIRSLGESQPARGLPLGPGEAMVLLIKRLRTAGLAAPGHKHLPLLGPDATDAAGEIVRPVAWWFQQIELAEDAAEQDQRIAQFLAALRHSKNGWIDVGNPARSRLVSSFFEYTHPMGRALSGPIPEAGGMTGRDIIWRWIKATCPIPGEAPRPAERLAEPPVDTVEARVAAAVAASASPARVRPPSDAVRAPGPGPRLRHGMGGYVH